MGIAFLLLGLVPLMFLPDMMKGDEPADTDDSSQSDDGEQGDGDLLLDISDPADQPSADTEILDPVNDIDLPDSGGQTDVPSATLTPGDAIDTDAPSDGNEGEVLDPIDDIDTYSTAIRIDAGADVGLGFAEIEDFEVGQDVLHITLEPETVSGTLDVLVSPSADGTDGHVFVEQRLIAVLKGVPHATSQDIIAEVRTIAA